MAWRSFLNLHTSTERLNLLKNLQQANTVTNGPFWINESDPDLSFPPIELALDEPNGLLAVGGDLSPERLIKAYGLGIFPWFSHDQPILWWSPNPRAVLFPAQLHVSRSLLKTIRRDNYKITLDRAFADVMQACAAPRPQQAGTWITPEMHTAYLQLHKMGIAHSVEAWLDGELVGGLYGLNIGQAFFGESMFSRANNASKVAFVYLTKQLQAWQFKLIDCQVSSEHLESLGARDIERTAFIKLLQRAIQPPAKNQKWQFDQNFQP